MTLRNPANWSDPPTADQVAWAIVAASREVGADPLAVARGEVQPRIPSIGQARSYAAKALAKVFTSYPRTRLAGLVGCRGLVRQSYFSALDQRIRSGVARWWDESALARVVAAVPVGEWPLVTVHGGALVEVAKLPAAKPVAKAPAPDLEDDAAPVFDRGSLAGLKKPQDHRPRAMSKVEMQADLEDALRRTALMQKPED